MNDQLLSHRPADEADLAEVVGFVRNADELFYAFPRAHWPLSREQLLSAYHERQGNTLALLDGRAAGFANFYQSQPGEFCALGNLMIAPWARGAGVAQYLIGVMERLAERDFQARELRASCFNHNSAGLLLYARQGYQLCGVVERSRNDQRVALLQFSKSLKS
ncbi:GNAT family N-acetyltransferase [Aquipseudomonas ullengensis]|uniref:GNAT family N-acetyltransferase n=1 Tax=Aquipseudomonas ullengensis TaxID=2759166 RepID=A0A7W4LHP9_9GAMM|nr:GNAT family N-acetyltransferase [Pseudomonas ullengensis]MBB2493390.1 GNAT family N-acetyltransferase [Pseudomonas ullengensis]